MKMLLDTSKPQREFKENNKNEGSVERVRKAACIYNSLKLVYLSTFAQEF